MRLSFAMFPVAAAAACVSVGSTMASAATVAQTPTSVAVTFTQAEADVIATLNLGPALGQLPPNFTPEAKQRLAESITRYAQKAAQSPGSTLTIIVDTPIQAPPGVAVAIIP
ncbi:MULTISPECIES: hypothetical protein [Nocardia]|uniref:hypothetical protein n=1 Tax=Nocardia TaxID=1817 RepID=UPI002455A9BE|nr:MULTISPECIES: hypothetical protein [Nocardia]